jgi:hypothetical protein
MALMFHCRLPKRSVRESGSGRRDRSGQGGPVGSSERRIIASLLLTTEAVISMIPEQPQHATAAMGGMGGGMY